MFLAKVLMDAEYTCGSTGLAFSGMFPYLVSSIVNIIKIAVPILLIVFGLLDLTKAVVASKEDEIKKSQGLFVKRLIAAIIVFLAIHIVQVIINFVSNRDVSVAQCFNCFIKGGTGETACEVVDSY